MNHRRTVSFQVMPVIGKAVRDILYGYPRALIWAWPAWVFSLALGIVGRVEIAFQQAPFFHYLALTNLHEVQSQVWGVRGLMLIMPVVVFTTRLVLEDNQNGDRYLSTDTWRRFLRILFLLMIGLVVGSVLLIMLYLTWLLIDKLDPQNRLRGLGYITTALGVWATIFTLATRLVCTMPLALLERKYPIAASWHYTQGNMKKLVILLLIMGPANALMTMFYSLLLVFIFYPLVQIPTAFCNASVSNVVCASGWSVSALGLTIVYMTVVFYFVVGSSTSANAYFALKQFRQRKSQQIAACKYAVNYSDNVQSGKLAARVTLHGGGTNQASDALGAPLSKSE